MTSQIIIDALRASSVSGEPFSVLNVGSDKEFATLQQRLRNAAKKLGYKVMIRCDYSEGTLYFKVPVRTKSSSK